MSTRLLDWIERELKPERCNSEEFFYDEMESQSGYCLPVIYQDFDISSRMHWCDRGALCDFLLSTDGEGKRLLDFGPGDGWPSLIVAPLAGEVIGVEGSRKRRDVCEQNASRLGISNASFVYGRPGSALPFDDDTFDGVMAASSVEQTPDPRATLRELFRVLRPGGRLRVMYEDAERYRGRMEHEVTVESLGDRTSRMVLYDRRISEETARMYKIVISLPVSEILKILGNPQPPIGFEAIPEDKIAAIAPRVTVARLCELRHPSGPTLVRWLGEAGFGRVLPTHGGRGFAGALYDRLKKDQRPVDMTELDRLLRPLVGITVELGAPAGINPPITAIK